MRRGNRLKRSLKTWLSVCPGLWAGWLSGPMRHVPAHLRTPGKRHPDRLPEPSRIDNPYHWPVGQLHNG